MRKTIVMLMVMALAASLPAAAQFPRIPAPVKKAAETGQKAAEANKPWTPEDERNFGQASAAKLIHIFGLYQNPDMTKYVNLVGNTVAKQATRTDVQYHFAILDTDVVNAMAMPGGFIFVTRGALSMMDNEAELAGVLAHEVAHVDGRHLEKEIRQKANVGLAVETGKSVGAVQNAANQIPGGQVALNWATNILQQALTAPYGRNEESEADKHGLDFASKAGYGPLGLRDFLQALADQQAQASPDSAKKFSLLTSTHPPLANRVASLNALLPSYADPGQYLKDRFDKNVNAKAFGGKATSSNAPAGAASASPSKAQAVQPVPVPQYEGVVRKGVVVLNSNAKLADGTKVTVTPQ